jgi:hypothetical protein
VALEACQPQRLAKVVLRTKPKAKREAAASSRRSRRVRALWNHAGINFMAALTSAGAVSTRPTHVRSSREIKEEPQTGFANYAASKGQFKKSPWNKSKWRAMTHLRSHKNT